MPSQPTQPAKPSTHQPPHQPAHPQPAPPPPKPAAPQPTEGLALGARPHDPHDPQSAKFEAQAGPPRWDEPGKAQRANQPPPPDGMSVADEQRERAADVEAHGLKAHGAVLDQRPDDEKPTFDPHALAGGGACVKAGKQRQIEGVAPPAKRGDD